MAQAALVGAAASGAVGNMEKLQSGDRASDTLETYKGYYRWDGDSEASMLFSISEGQGFKQGFVYGITLGFAALKNRIHNMHVYGADESLRKALENAHHLHGQMTIATLCSVAKEHKYGVENVKTKNVASSLTYWIWLRKISN